MNPHLIQVGVHERQCLLLGLSILFMKSVMLPSVTFSFAASTGGSRGLLCFTDVTALRGTSTEVVFIGADDCLSGKGRGRSEGREDGFTSDAAALTAGAGVL